MHTKQMLQRRPNAAAVNADALAEVIDSSFGCARARVGCGILLTERQA